MQKSGVRQSLWDDLPAQEGQQQSHHQSANEKGPVPCKPALPGQEHPKIDRLQEQQQVHRDQVGEEGFHDFTG